MNSTVTALDLNLISFCFVFFYFAAVFSESGEFFKENWVQVIAVLKDERNFPGKLKGAKLNLLLE